MILRKIGRWLGLRPGAGRARKKWRRKKIRRGPRHEARERARQLAAVLCSDRFRGRVALTSGGRRDGGGAQAHGVISILLLAEATGCRYLHSPFTEVGHAKGDPADFAGKWEAFLALGFGESPAPEKAERLPLGEFQAAPGSFAGRDILIRTGSVSYFPDLDPDRYETLIPRLRAKYHSSDKSALPLHRGAMGLTTVALHVRRGDVTADDPERYRRFTHDAAILRTLQDLRAVAGEVGCPLEIHLYSEGAAADFDTFAEAGCVLHLGIDVFETFHNLVMAEVLVMAKSSFSFVAALLSEGIVLYEPYRDSPLSRWIWRDATGALDRDRLIVALRNWRRHTKSAGRNA